MAKATSVWECQNCGSQFPKWAGKCPDCGTWNSLVETLPSADVPSPVSSPAIFDVLPQDWHQFKSQSQNIYLPTGISELDRVLGGGLVPGGVILIAGEPGIGKSTLLSQLALRMSDVGYRTSARRKINNGIRNPEAVLYVNGEESSLQVAARFRRLKSDSNKNIVLFPQTNVEAVMSHLSKTPGLSLLIVDSIQVMFSAKLRSSAGSIGQIRQSAAALIEIAKIRDIPTIMVGHFTKEGEVAGPKVLEHMVDTVLVMAGDRSGNLRILRSLKNRFGPVDEIGIFSMAEAGMTEVKNPAELLVGDLAAKAPGSVLGCVLEGQRPLVLEIQALAVPTKLSFPRRVGQGVSERRLQLLSAVIEKHLGLSIGEKDVFVNVAGGLKSSDPGLDLPVVAAIISSAGYQFSVVGSRSNVNRLSVSRFQTDKPKTGRPETENRKPKTDNWIFCGEVGLLGEVRMVPGWPRREKEVKRLGLGKLVGKAEIKHIGELRKFL